MVVTESSKVFIVVDALDELSDDCRPKFLPEIFKIQVKTNLNIFVTLRPTLNIEKEFKECILCQSLEIRAMDEDVECYLESRVSELRILLPKDLWKDIKTTILYAVKGMYVLPKSLKYKGYLC